MSLCRAAFLMVGALHPRWARGVRNAAGFSCRGGIPLPPLEHVLHFFLEMLVGHLHVDHGCSDRGVTSALFDGSG